MTSVVLIRHGAFDGIHRRLAGRAPGLHLNDQGRRQAERLAERLALSPVGAVFSTPRERACETAAPISRRLGIAFKVSEALDEIDFGFWTGRRFDELAGWRSFNSFRSHARIPGGESMCDVQARVVAEIERLCCRHPDSSLALVSHGDVIRAAVLHYAGIPLDLIERIEISPGSATVVVIRNDGARLIRMNDTGCEPLLCSAEDGSAGLDEAKRE